MGIETLTTFLGWCTVINGGMLILASLTVVSMRGTISGIHGRMFGLSEAIAAHEYFRYLAEYKIMIFIFNLVPYIALKIMF